MRQSAAHGSYFFAEEASKRFLRWCRRVVAGAMQLQINFNMSFLDLSCDFLSVDALDILGSNRVNITGGRRADTPSNARRVAAKGGVASSWLAV